MGNKWGMGFIFDLFLFFEIIFSNLLFYINIFQKSRAEITGELIGFSLNFFLSVFLVKILNFLR